MTGLGSSDAQSNHIGSGIALTQRNGNTDRNSNAKIFPHPEKVAYPKTQEMHPRRKASEQNAPPRNYFGFSSHAVADARAARKFQSASLNWLIAAS